MMATKDISDLQVVRAYEKARRSVEIDGSVMLWPEGILMDETGQPLKVCFSAMSRACNRQLIDYGISLRSGFLTPEGQKLLDDWAGS